MDFRKMLREQAEKNLDRSYGVSLSAKTLSFDAWIREKEKDLETFDMTVLGKSAEDGPVSYATRYGALTIRILPFTLVREGMALGAYIEDILVFTNGKLTETAIPLIAKAFSEKNDVAVVYGDEDLAEIREENGEYGHSLPDSRKEPYFKPDWSPNAFLTHFYFCNITALRRNAFRDTVITEGEGADALYRMLIRELFQNEFFVQKGVFHIDEILLHAGDYEQNRITAEDCLPCTYGLKVRSYGERGYDLEHKATLSVVIPSKDHPEMLEKCISSLKDACPGAYILQIVVVDNGSSRENRDRIEDLSLKYGFTYCYSQMEFNFARMINLGVEKGSGEYLLLLNDDVYFTEPYTLERMVEQASYRFTGAVGCKLLYPESGRIQHAGVVNTRIGPVHKLQFKDDAEEYYFGWNRYTGNLLAVTGACLMVRRELFEKAGGLNEKFRVAFNDVDFCYTLYESGYFNACVREVSLCHAESVSRGNDRDAESLKRLLSEKRLLDESHPAFHGKDPFYGKYLLGDCLDTGIRASENFEEERNLFAAGSVRKISLAGAREEQCLTVSLEYAGTMSGYTFREEDREKFLFEGFSFVQGSDNAAYKRSVLLKDGDNVYEILTADVLREDLAENCPDQKNVALSGFLLSLDRKLLPKGRYQIGILQKRKFSKERLFCFSNRELVNEDGL